MKDIEHKIQVGIIRYLRLNKIDCFAVPNGGQRNLIVAKKLKDEGALSGVSDIIILEDGTCRFVEIKQAKGRQQESQKEFERIVSDHNMVYEIWRSLDDARNYISKLHNREGVWILKI